MTRDKSYLSAGFDENILRNPAFYQYSGALYDNSNIGDLLSAGSEAIGGDLIQAGAITQDKIEGISILGWVNALTFSALSNTKVSWNAGAITLADGTSYSIQAGDTGDMSAVTYVYFDLAVSSTVLQKTTTATDAVGANKILVAVAQNVAAGKLAIFQVFGGKGVGVLLTADNIAAGTITTNELAANSVKANNIDAGAVTAIKIAAGAITADKIAAGEITADKIATGQLIVGTNVGLGSATTLGTATTYIVGNYITTGYINALSITAGSVNASNITAGTITGSNILSSGSGGRILLSNGDRLYFYDGGGAIQGYMYGAGDDMVIGANDNLQLGAGGSYRIRVTDGSLFFYNGGYRVYWGAEGYFLKPDSDKLVVNANFCSNTHRGNTLGSSSREWSDVCTRYLHVANVAYADEWRLNSDRKLKKNIDTIENCLKKINMLNGVSFNWKSSDKSKKKQLGLIAQDVKKIIPELVSENNDRLHLNYTGLIPVIVEAIKELNYKIDKLS